MSQRQNVKQSRIFHDALDRIKGDILKGRLAPGDKLPPERELMETLQISRATLREVRRVLEQQGLVEVRLGSKGGAYVKAFSIDHIAGDLDLLIRQKKISLRHLYEFREGVEGVAAGLATERHTEKDLQPLKEVMEEALRCIEGSRRSWLAFYEMESRLHQMVARLSGNPLYEWVLRAIHTNIHSYAHLMPRDRKILRSFYNDWKTILEAMGRREVTRVQTLTRAHTVRGNTYARTASRRHGQELSNIILKL